MKLLLVEDEKRMVQALCEILRLEKYDVDHCADGLEGLDSGGIISGQQCFRQRRRQ